MRMGRAGVLLVDGTAEEHLRIGALEERFGLYTRLALPILYGVWQTKGGGSAHCTMDVN